MAKKFYRIILGKAHRHFDQCKNDGFIGADYGFRQSLEGHLPENWRDFNAEFIPVFLKKNPEKSRVAAGLACGALYTVAKGINSGDIVLCPDGEGNYLVGEVSGQYYFESSETLPHRRRVSWFEKVISKGDMSIPLRNSVGSIAAVSEISKYANEIGALIRGNVVALKIVSDEAIEDPSNFFLEKHLEDFLVDNWKQTELGKKYDIFADGENLIGQQYRTDTGPIDILAISKDKKELLVIELKKGRASDAVVGQVQRYMGYVLEDLAEDGQTVRGAIIALEDDQRIKRALSVAPNIEFYRYKITFSLTKHVR